MSDDTIKIFTIGFAGSTAEIFFERLKKAGVRKVIDTRLWPSTQLSGFARKKDLPYFLKTLANIDYDHQEDLAPSETILKDYKNKKIDWASYEERYLNLLQQRRIAEKIKPDDVNQACFLCAEAQPHHCHRRLLAEHLQKTLNQPIEIIHL